MTRTTSAETIRVKFMAGPRTEIWRRQFPDDIPIWGRCEFIFDLEEGNYDWLVVYDDLPPTSAKERRSVRQEVLSCSALNTLLVTQEPSSIKSYFTDFTDQFGWVLTSQPDWALPHPRKLYQQAGLFWFYGVGSSSTLSFNDIERETGWSKTDRVGTVCSSKQQTHTLHSKRYNFTQELKKLLPAIDIYGKGVAPIDDKAESIKPYKYHLAIENHISAHHWTEKLADPFLGEALPFYIGCPNATDYFPPDSFIALDINDPEGSAKIIKKAIETDEYGKRRPAILEAKKRVLFQHNLFAILSKHIEANFNPEAKVASTIFSRRLLIKRSLRSRLRHGFQKAASRMCHLWLSMNNRQ